VHGLRQQDLAHQHMIKGRPAVLRPVSTRHNPLQLRPEQREIHQRRDLFEVITLG
jgi:hypothetical protein